MEIKHRVSLDCEGIEDIIKSLGIRYFKNVPFGNVIISFDINESDSRWPKIQGMIQDENGGDIFDTVFTKQEILSARWNRLIQRFLRGYPQPETGWEDLTYENECPECGAGYKQRAPFRIKEPRMGKNEFLQLFWTNSTFCTPKVIDVLKAEGIKGYEVWPAIIQRTKQPSPTVSQLIFSHVMEPGLAEVDRVQPEVCPECGVVKYAFHLRGYMHIEKAAINPELDVQETFEWFGSGSHLGYREILISNRFARLIIGNRWKGVQLKPVKLV